LSFAASSAAINRQSSPMSHTVLLGETSWWYPPNAAVRVHFAVVAPTGRDRHPGLMQCLEPVFVQALIADATIKTSM